MAHHIAIRRGQGNPLPGETPHLAEPKWDPLKSRFGVFNNIGFSYEWYPRVFGEYCMLNSNQLFTGETAAGDHNNVVVDFSVPNELIVRNNVSGIVLARYTDSAVYLHNPVSVGSAEVGISNKALNGNLSVVFGAAPPTFPMTTILAVESQLVAPNWLLWKGPGSSGAMSVAFDENDAPPGVERSFIINASGAVNHSGLRSYVYDYTTMRGKEIVVSGSFKGSDGRSCMMRVGNANGVIYSHEFTFIGDVWKDVSFSTNVPDEDGGYLYIDFVYAPSRTNPALTVFRAAKFQLALGRTPPRYEARSREVEYALLKGIFKEGSVWATGEAFAGIDLGLCPGSELDISAFSTGGTVAVTQANYLGAAVNIPGGSGLNRINYRATSIIRTDETA